MTDDQLKAYCKRFKLNVDISFSHLYEAHAASVVGNSGADDYMEFADFIDEPKLSRKLKLRDQRHRQQRVEYANRSVKARDTARAEIEQHNEGPVVLATKFL